MRSRAIIPVGVAVQHQQARRVEVESLDSLPLALRELRGRLRRRADRKIANALGIQVLLLAGWKRPQIQQRLGLTDDEYRHAHRWLRDDAELQAQSDPTR